MGKIGRDAFRLIVNHPKLRKIPMILETPKEGPDGKDRGMNPYYHGRGIFKYDPALHATTKIAPSDFTEIDAYAEAAEAGERVLVTTSGSCPTDALAGWTVVTLRP